MRVNSFVPSMEIFKNKNEEEVVEKSSLFADKLNELNEKQIAGDKAVENFINGDIDVHEMMLTTEEAKMSLQLAVQVRNKVIEAVQELTKMQL